MVKARAVSRFPRLAVGVAQGVAQAVGANEVEGAVRKVRLDGVGDEVRRHRSARRASDAVEDARVNAAAKLAEPRHVLVALSYLSDS